jgi:hypothetical protein
VIHDKSCELVCCVSIYSMQVLVYTCVRVCMCLCASMHVHARECMSVRVVCVHLYIRYIKVCIDVLVHPSVIRKDKGPWDIGPYL